AFSAIHLDPQVASRQTIGRDAGRQREFLIWNMHWLIKQMHAGKRRDGFAVDRVLDAIDGDDYASTHRFARQISGHEVVAATGGFNAARAPQPLALVKLAALDQFNRTIEVLLYGR